MFVFDTPMLPSFSPSFAPLSPAAPARALPAGTRLGEYEIERVVCESSDSVLYQAHDPGLQRKVALREYLPEGLAIRTAGGEVAPLSPGHVEPFEFGLRAFAHEARLLGHCDHPSLLKILRYWEEHQTAYMAMPWYEGKLLQACRQEMRRPPEEQWLRSLLLDVSGALEALHVAFSLHREITPARILLQPDERAVLLGFHAARSVISQWQGPAADPFARAYAPLELHPEGMHLQQGPGTDLYSLAAVAYFCLTGTQPPSATERSAARLSRPFRQVMQSLGARHPGLDYSSDFLAALDWAFELQPQYRPRSAAEWRAVLQQQSRAPAGAHVAALRPTLQAREAANASTAAQAATTLPPGASPPEPPRHEAPPPAAPGEQFAHALHAAGKADLFSAQASHEPAPPPSSSAANTLPPLQVEPSDHPLHVPRSSASRSLWRWPVAALLVLLAGAAAWQWGRRAAELPSPGGAGSAAPPSREAPPLAASPVVRPPVVDTSADASRPLSESAASGLQARPASPPLSNPATPPLQPATAPAPARAVSASPPPPPPPAPALGVPAPPARTAAATPTAPPVRSANPPSGGASGPRAKVAPRPAVPKPRLPQAQSRTANGKNERPQPVRTQGREGPPKAPPPLQWESPRAACAPRERFSLYYCMQQQCKKPEFQRHRQCVVLRHHDVID